MIIQTCEAHVFVHRFPRIPNQTMSLLQDDEVLQRDVVVMVRGPSTQRNAKTSKRRPQLKVPFYDGVYIWRHLFNLVQSNPFHHPSVFQFLYSILLLFLFSILCPRCC